MSTTIVPNTTVGSITQLSGTVGSISSSSVISQYERLKRQIDKEKSLREKYPAIQAAYENYQNLLKLTGEL